MEIDSRDIDKVKPPQQSQEERIPEESYYVNKDMFCRLQPEDIHQPKGKIYRG